MRLLIVTHYYADHRGGVEIVAGELAARFAARGIEVVWAASGPAPLQPIPGVTALPMTAWNGVERWMGLPCPVWSPGSLRKLRKAVLQADVVQLHDTLYLGNLFAGWQADRAGKPLLITQHIGELSFRSRFLTAVASFANRRVAARRLRSADQTVFISTAVLGYFAARTTFAAPPRLIPNGVDLARFQPIEIEARTALRKSLAWDLARPQLLFVGRFVEKKGLKILEGLARRFPECDWHFAGWGPLDPQAWQLPHVHCHGSVDRERIPDYFRAADLLILPSSSEGFPLVVQEAMACGTPALVTPCSAEALPGVAEQVSCAEPDLEAMTVALRSLLDDPHSLMERRPAVARFAREQWDWDRCADEYVRLMRDLAPASPAPDLSPTTTADETPLSTATVPDTTLATKRLGLGLLGLIVFVVLLWNQRHAFTQVDWGAVRLFPALAGVLSMGVGLAAMTCRTWLVARLAAPSASFRETGRTTFLGMLSSYTFLGMYVGLGLLSWFLIRRCGVAPVRAGLLVAVDRIIGFGTMLLLGACAAFWAPGAGSWLMGPAGLTATIIAACVLVWLGWRWLPGLQRKSSEAETERVAWRPRASQWLPLVGVSCLAHLACITGLWCVAHALPLPTEVPSWGDHAVMFPQLELASFLIPTPAGLGVREGMLCLLYDAVLDTDASLDRQAGILVACAFRLLTLAVTVIGLLSCGWKSVGCSVPLPARGEALPLPTAD